MERDGFPTTVWDLLDVARGGDRRALEDLCGRYREPVLAFLRVLGVAQGDEEDLCQEVFVRLLDGDVVGKADPTRGRFRGLLRTVARCVVRDAWRLRGAARRGGGRPVRSLDDPIAPGHDTRLGDALPGAPEAGGEEAFDLIWVRHLLSVGLDRLGEECARSGTRYHRVLSLHLFEDLDPVQVADRLRIDPVQARQDLLQARRRLRHHIRREISTYVGSASEFRREARALEEHLG